MRIKTISLSIPGVIFITLFSLQGIMAQTTGYKGETIISGPEADITAIKSTLTNLYTALAERDANAYAAQTAPGYYVLEQGEYWDLEYTLNRIGNGKPAGYIRKDRIDYKMIEVCKESAFVIWDLFAEVTRDGKTTNYQWLESGTLKKIEGEWKVQILHSTRVEPK